MVLIRTTDTDEKSKYKRLKLWDKKTSPQVVPKREDSGDLPVEIYVCCKEGLFLRERKSSKQIFVFVFVSL